LHQDRLHHASVQSGDLDRRGIAIWSAWYWEAAAGSADTIMRGLLAENLKKPRPKLPCGDHRAQFLGRQCSVPRRGRVTAAPDGSSPGRSSGGIGRAGRTAAPSVRRTGTGFAIKSLPPLQRPPAAPSQDRARAFTNGVIQTQQFPRSRSSEPMKPSR